MNAKQLKAWEARTETRNHQQADRLRDDLADVIMQNGRLSAEVAMRWAKKQGYLFTPKAKAK